MTPPDRGGRRWLQLLIGVAISAVLIWFAFRDTPFSEVWNHITAMRIGPMAVAVVLATLPFALRVPRWQLLLQREDGSRIEWRPMWHAIAIGFAANNVLPARIGEVLRMGAIARLVPVPFPAALASVAIERVIDALTAVALLGIALLLVDLPADAGIARSGTVFGALALTALLTAIAVVRWPELALRPIRSLLPDGRFRDAVLGVVLRLVGGLSALGDADRALPVVGWSLLIWLVNASAFWVAFFAFGIEVSLAGAIILQAALLIGIALPQAPGFAGGFELAIVIALSLFGVERDVALAYAISYHVLTFVPITLLGVHSLLTTGLSLRSAREAAS